jgi:hypothetical protein
MEARPPTADKDRAGWRRGKLACQSRRPSRSVPAQPGQRPAHTPVLSVDSEVGRRGNLSPSAAADSGSPRSCRPAGPAAAGSAPSAHALRCSCPSWLIFLARLSSLGTRHSSQRLRRTDLSGIPTFYQLPFTAERGVLSLQPVKCTAYFTGPSLRALRASVRDPSLFPVTNNSFSVYSKETEPRFIRIHGPVCRPRKKILQAYFFPLTPARRFVR